MDEFLQAAVAKAMIEQAGIPGDVVPVYGGRIVGHFFLFNEK